MTKKEPVRQYPREVWVLSTGYQLKRVTIVGTTQYGDWDRAMGGKLYEVDELHDTKEQAIDWGRKKIVKRRQSLENQVVLLNEYAAKLEKYEKN